LTQRVSKGAIRPGGRDGRRRDENERAIVKALTLAGASVTLLSIPGGPDLLVGHRRRTFLAEVKSERGRVNKLQEVWHGEWRGGDVVILRTVEQALQMIGVLAR
jgi:hypothetical protein